MEKSRIKETGPDNLKCFVILGIMELVLSVANVTDKHHKVRNPTSILARMRL